MAAHQEGIVLATNSGEAKTPGGDAVASEIGFETARLGDGRFGGVTAVLRRGLRADDIMIARARFAAPDNLISIGHNNRARGASTAIQSEKKLHRRKFNEITRFELRALNYAPDVSCF